MISAKQTSTRAANPTYARMEFAQTLQPPLTALAMHAKTAAPYQDHPAVANARGQDTQAQPAKQTSTSAHPTHA